MRAERVKTVLLRVWSSNENWNPIRAAVVELDGELALRLLALRKEYDKLRKREERLSEISIFDYSVTYLEEDRLSDAVADMVHVHLDGEDSSELEVPELIAAKLTDDDDGDWDYKYGASMEVNRILVSEHGIKWSALVKHTEVEITTAYLDYTLIREVAGL